MLISWIYKLAALKRSVNQHFDQSVENKKTKTTPRRPIHCYFKTSNPHCYTNVFVDFPVIGGDVSEDFSLIMQINSGDAQGQ